MDGACELTLSQVLTIAADELRPDACHPQHVSAEEMQSLLTVFEQTATMARRLEATVRELRQALADEADVVDPEAVPVPDNVIQFPSIWGMS